VGAGRPRQRGRFALEPHDPGTRSDADPDRNRTACPRVCRALASPRVRGDQSARRLAAALVGSLVNDAGPVLLAYRVVVLAFATAYTGGNGERAR